MDRGLLRTAAVAVVCVAGLVCVPVGASGAQVQPRVVGGSVAPAGAYPWQAAVRFDASRFGGTDAQQQFCGGVLVAPRLVLTAAHCVFDTDPDRFLGICPDGCELDPNDVDVVLNEPRLSSGGGERYNVQAVYYQPQYNPGAFTADVGYLVLAAASSLPPLKIAGPSEGSIWVPGSPTQVSGYGSQALHGAGSDDLRVATVPVLPDSTCGSASYYGSLFDPSTMLCAGYAAGGVDSCQGDSGGPLQAPMPAGGFRLVGLVSFGAGCAEPRSPGVYARLGAGGPGALFQVVLDEVASIEAAQGLGHTDIVGRGLAAVPPASDGKPGQGAKKKKKKRCKVPKHGTRKAKKKARAKCAKRKRKRKAGRNAAGVRR